MLISGLNLTRETGARKSCLLVIRLQGNIGKLMVKVGDS